jgi:hypothetical protein
MPERMGVCCETATECVIRENLQSQKANVSPSPVLWARRAFVTPVSGDALLASTRRATECRLAYYEPRA